MKLKTDPATRTRVRLEFTAFRQSGRLRVLADKKLTALRVLLIERFGDRDGRKLYQDWITYCTADQDTAIDLREAQ